MLLPGNELIQFQKKSLLGEALEKVFQDAIDYKNSIEFSDQISEMKKYCRSTFKQNLIQAFQKNANVLVDNVIIEFTYPSLMFAITVGDYGQIANDIHYLTNQGYGVSKISTPTKEMDTLKKIYDGADDETGKIKDIVINKHPLKIVLYFDAAIGLLCDHFADSKIIEPLTARELTAIYLHEMGHFYNSITRMTQAYFCIDRSTQHLLKFSNKYQAADVARSVIDNKQYFESLTDNENSALISVCTTCANTILYVNDTIENKDDLKISSVDRLDGLKILLTNALCILINAIMCKYIFRYITSIGDEITTSLQPNELTQKYSDIIRTTMNYQYNERDADNFSVRQGYGPELISGLQKFEKLFTLLIPLSRANYNALKLQKIGSGYNLLKLVAEFYKYSIYHSIQIKYESPLNRYSRICQDWIGALKELPNEQRYEWIDKYEKMLAEFEEAKKESSTLIPTIAKTVSTLLLSPKVLIDNIITGRVSKDYTRFFNQIDELINNKLYYYSAKIKNLYN